MYHNLANVREIDTNNTTLQQGSENGWEIRFTNIANVTSGRTMKENPMKYCRQSRNI